MLGLILLGGILSGCTGEADPLFERLPSEQTGIDFTNTIAEDDSLLNPVEMEYVYNGAGVAAGDFDGDGRPDLYFAGNQVDGRLYLNRGDLRFEDVTEQAGVAAPGTWATGVAAVDINQDGRLDLYVCAAGPGRPEDRVNRLYINRGTGEDGVPRFEERAADYGLDDAGYSTHAAFFDYDGDGDLDVYLLTNALEDVNKNRVRPRRTEGQAESTDRLYRNNGDGTFTDVSEEAGIQIEGYGLGVVVSDLNKDGWPDVYVANDFLTNELVYVNNGDGTFTNKAGAWLQSQTHNGMGADVADYNNDGRPDIVVLDMLPPDNYRRKMMIPSGNHDIFRRALEAGYEPQYLRNTLQLSRGRGPDGELVFSEIGRLAGVAATDWSWAPLLADFDNDGWKDLFVTNGYGKDITNLDFVAHGNQASAFGSEEANRKVQMEALRALPEVLLQNRMYRNDGDLTFSDETQAWGAGPPSLSTGAAFADLDGDGDLDLAVSNINDEAFVLANRLSERDTTRTYLRVRLEGPPGNRAGLGARLALYSKEPGEEPLRQYHEHTRYRGYKSTVEATAHFGLGGARQVDTLEVVWPDGRYALLADVAANQTITLRHAEAVPDAPPQTAAEAGPRPFLDALHVAAEPLFREEAVERGLDHEHVEYEVEDFRQAPLLPHQLSRGGPSLAVGDVDGNGLDDVFVGADRRQERRLFLQAAPGRFEPRPFSMPKTERDRYEDRGALFFDADGDGHLDLYVASGGNHAPAEADAYRDRLYLGDGRGGFRRADAGTLPALTSPASVVTAADYDGDGDLDLFVGGRHRPGSYPLAPRSYLLRNDSDETQVRFTDVTEEVAPELAEVGMVTDALWSDVDGDGQRDLLVVGEWMPITLFANRGNRFEEATAEAGLIGTAGWWNSLAAGDFDGDGDLDYVAGNQGQNDIFDASPEAPVRIYAKDYDRNGRLDPVMTHYIEGEEVPAHPRDLLVEQVPAMMRRFSSYEGYAEASFEDVFTEPERDGAEVMTATRLETSYLENRGDGTFRVRALPLEAQFAPVFGMQAGDYDGDGHLDLLLVGNSYASDPGMGWQDALAGLLLRGDGEGGFEPIGPAASGFFAGGDAKALAAVAQDEEPPLMVMTQTNGMLKAFAQRGPRAEHAVRLQPADRSALLTFEDGTQRREEFHHGAGHRSQSSRVLRVPASAVEVVIVDAAGGERTLDLEPDSLLAGPPSTE